MYSTEQNRQFQELTQQWLQAPESKGIAAVEELRQLLRFHEYRYYVMDDALIADAEYDVLFRQLEQLETSNPEIITPDSPTQRVGKGLSSSFPTVQHLVPMLSLENSYNAEDLLDWDRKARELTGLEEIDYCIEPKFDGASISLIYENDLLTRAATRGDGVEGEEITTNIRQIRSLPLSARFSDSGIQQIEIRGEVLINKKNFAKFNEGLIAQNIPPLANPRNAASGSLRMKDPREVGKRNLEAFLYHVSDVTTTTGGMPKQLLNHSDSLKLLWDLGFRSPVREMRVFKGIQPLIDFCLAFEAGRDDLPYEIDGMVIKVNNLELQEKMGMTTHHPRWAIAFKFKARQATTKLRAVEFQVGRTGAVTPVAKLDPVFLGGVTVGSISVHNEEYIKEKDLKIGDTVLIERAGDVIPQIVQSRPDLRDGTEQEIIFPKTCPVCNSELYKEEGEAVWRCINIECKAQVVERIIHFVSKDAMDIRSLGEANVRKFYELGLLRDIPEIYRLDLEEIGKMEGFGSKSVTNLREAIEKSKQQPLHRIIYALGIRYVGETTAKVLARAAQHILDFRHFSEEQLLALEDVGPKVAGSIFRFFHNEANLHMLQELEENGLNLRNQHKDEAASGNLSGQTFLFTGTLTRFKRSDAEAMVEANGGKLLGGVSSKLNYLVVGDDAGSKLEKAKKIPSIKVITENEFLQLFG